VSIGEGQSYKGQWRGEFRSGTGVIEWEDGDTFKGFFKNSQPVVDVDASIYYFAFSDDEQKEFFSTDKLEVVAHSELGTHSLCELNGKKRWISSDQLVSALPSPLIVLAQVALESLGVKEGDVCTQLSAAHGSLSGKYILVKVKDSKLIWVDEKNFMKEADALAKLNFDFHVCPDIFGIRRSPFNSFAVSP
jgi:hypothetical protein